MGDSWIRIHPDDHVAVALRDLSAGEPVGGVTLAELLKIIDQRG